MLSTILTIINLAFQLVTLLVIVHVFISYFVPPYHPVREKIDMLVSPMLNPIRRLLPQTGMIDFSPMVLILILQLARSLVINLILSLI